MKPPDLSSSPEWQRVLRHFELIEAPVHHVPGYIVLLVADARTATACREGLCAFLQAREAALHITLVDTPETLGHVAIALRRLSISPEIGAVWVECVVGDWEDRFETWRAAWQRAAVGLNRSRDTLLSSIPAPILLVGAPWLMETLKTFSPDLWSVRSLVANVAVPSPANLGSLIAEIPEEATPGDAGFATRQAGKYRGVSGKEEALVHLLSRASASWLAEGKGGKAAQLAGEATRILLERDLTETSLTAATQLARLNYRFGRLRESMALYRKLESFHDKTGNRLGFAECLGGRALILLNWGMPDDALLLLERQEAIFRQLAFTEGLQATFGNRALVLSTVGRIDEAAASFRQQQAIFRQVGDDAGLARSYCSHAVASISAGCLEEAAALLEKAEAITSRTGDLPTLQAIYGNQALLLQEQGRWKEALSLRGREEDIASQLGDTVGLARSRANRGILLAEAGNHKEAVEYLVRALDIFTRLEMPREQRIVKDWKHRIGESNPASVST